MATETRNDYSKGVSMEEKLELVKLCKVEDLTPGDSQVFKTSIGQIALFRTRSNKLFATAARCPHKGGPIAHSIYNGESHLTCPLHGYTFSVEDGICTDETLGKSLTVYALEIREGWIYAGKAESKVSITELTLPVS